MHFPHTQAEVDDAAQQWRHRYKFPGTVSPYPLIKPLFMTPNSAAFGITPVFTSPKNDGIGRFECTFNKADTNVESVKILTII